MKKIAVSGIRPTGKIHLGNYFGAMKRFAEMQNKYQCYFFVADYHSLTTLRDPSQLKGNIPGIVLDYLATGLDPERCVLFAQSSVPEIPELALLLSMVQPVGELQRLPTFQEKAAKQPDNVNAGLLFYPVLMAADILIHRANLVPTGRDQEVHIRVTKSIAGRFNSRFGDLFPTLESFEEEAIKVPGLDGTPKMGKSEGNTLNLSDSPDTICEKLKTAVTDTERKRRTDPGNPYNCNMYSLHELVSSKETTGCIRVDCQKANIGCIDCKQVLAQNIINLLAPIQEKRRQLEKDEHLVESVLCQGGLKARESAMVTLEQTREKMGLSRFKETRNGT